VPNALISFIHGPAGALRRLAPVALLGLAACSTINNYVPGFVKPYRADVQQGNWLTQEQVELLRPGMTREQVRFALGSPTLTSIFHADRWDYPYLFTPGHGQTEERRFTVYFVNDRLDRWTGDEQPARQPFQQKDTRRALGTGTSATPPQAQAGEQPATQGSAGTAAQNTQAGAVNNTPLTVDGNAAPTSLDPSAPPPPVATPVAPPAADPAPSQPATNTKE